MRHLGDITKINGAEAPIVDCVIGGSPCQDLSVAGKRAGLAGERSGLFMEQIRIIKEMREHDKLRRQNGYTRSNEPIRPRYMVWENVPGAFSSNNGEDFRAVLEETAKVADPTVSIPRPDKGKWTKAGCIIADGWSLAWRVFNAEFYGVPQRRRRIALIADFGGQSASEILFVRKGCTGNFEPSQQAREDSSPNASGSLGAGDSNGCNCDGGQLSPTLTANNASGSQRMPDKDNFNCVIQPAVVYKGDGAIGGETSFAIVGNHDSRPTDLTNLVVEMDRSAYNQGKNAKFDFGISEDGVAHTVLAKGPGAVAYAMERYHCSVENEISPPIMARDYKDPNVVAYAEPQAVDLTNMTESDVNGALQASSAHNTHSNNVVRIRYIVRRLTPLECERLQGYPDGWTDIGEYTDSKGKKCKTSDAARYKALGNSIALPQWKWVLKRLCAQYERDATMASLFDGIGGFPLIWTQLNGKGSCLWASEIEEFPIAVTKKHFGE